MIVEMYQLSFCVFMCAFYLEITSFFSVRVSSFISYFLCYPIISFSLNIIYFCCSKDPSKNLSFKTRQHPNRFVA